jgi:glycosyltransferase involved in cell wall biosynthesis
MIEVTAITGSKTQSSSRFRVRQHIEPLSRVGIRVGEYSSSIDGYELTPSWIPKSVSTKYNKPIRYLWQASKIVDRIPAVLGSRNGDITWLLRGLIPYRFTLESFLQRPLVFDVDDAIWLVNYSSYSADSAVGDRIAKSIIKIAERADIIVAGNNHLAQWFEPYNSKIEIVPTAVDTQRYHPIAKTAEKSDRFIIGWIGSDPRNILEAERLIERFMHDFSDSELLVIAGKAPVLKRLPPDRVKFIPWSPTIEVEAIQQMDVGLMPLADTEYNKGKCSFKMLQYMACGIPTIVSSVGMNLEVLAMGEIGIGVSMEKESDWYDVLELFYQNRELGKLYGQQGRKIVEQYFSQNAIVEKLATVFKQLV